MIRKFLALVVGMAALSLTVAPAADEEKKTLTGTLVCGKCKLSETDKCSHVLLVKEKGKKDEVKYYLVDKGAKEKYHPRVCRKDEEGVKVTGKIVEKEMKKYIEEPKVEFKKS
jgi:hypothetical protein